MLLAVLALAPALAGSVPVSQDDDRTRAPHFVIEGESTGDAIDRLPLKATHARVRVVGVIAHVTVQQVWENAGSEPIEANYVFPASTRAAVFGMRMRVGDRVLRAKIKKRAAARKIYEKARDEGRTASLLEQERANVFSMHVANILPGARIEVELDYTELLVPRDKEYELVYPQVTGPRYAKGESASESWIKSPFLSEGQGAPWSSSISVDLKTAVRVRDVHSPSHNIAPTFPADDRVALQLARAANEGGGAKDFVLRWRVVGDDIETGALLYRDKERGENFFLLMAEPPERVSDRAMPARELVFIVDVSGSMSGFPTETARALMERLLGTLRPQDTFNVMHFASTSSLLSETSLRATKDNVARARAGDRDMAVGGGTNLDAALERALKLPTSADTSRSFVVITDGYVGFENRVFDLVRDNLSRANVYAFGVGSSVNRLLIEGIAKAGLGEPFVVLDEKSAAREVKRFDHAISRPALTNVRVRFEGFDAYDLEPSASADLLEDRPLVVTGKFRGPSTGRIRVTGTAGDRDFARVIQVEDHLEKNEHEALRYLWARGRIAHLADVGTPDDEEIEEVTRLGLKYRLLTKWTSFVAVDYELRNPKGAPTAVDQPQPLPEGVSNQALSAGQLFSQRTAIDFSDVSIEGELIKPEGAYLKSRKTLKVRSAMPVRKDFREKMGEAYGVGGLGMTGVGAGGGGVANLFGAGARRGGIDLGGRGKGMTRVRPGKVRIQGSLSRDVIQRVMRSATNQLRYCYERELRRTPGLRGKVVVKLTVDKDGKATAVKIEADTLKSEAVTACLKARVKRLRFPKPQGGGKVIITYPILFSPSK